MYRTILYREIVIRSFGVYHKVRKTPHSIDIIDSQFMIRKLLYQRFVLATKNRQVKSASQFPVNRGTHQIQRNRIKTIIIHKHRKQEGGDYKRMASKLKAENLRKPQRRAATHTLLVVLSSVDWHAGLRLFL